MKYALRALLVVLLGVALLFSAVGSVRWAKRGGSATRVLASALVLGLGMGLVVKPPQPGIEQAQEERHQSGGETGDPPDPCNNG